MWPWFRPPLRQTLTRALVLRLYCTIIRQMHFLKYTKALIKKGKRKIGRAYNIPPPGQGQWVKPHVLIQCSTSARVLTLPPASSTRSTNTKMRSKTCKNTLLRKRAGSTTDLRSITPCDTSVSAGRVRPKEASYRTEQP